VKTEDTPRTSHGYQRGRPGENVVADQKGHSNGLDRALVLNLNRDLRVTQYYQAPEAVGNNCC